MLQNYVTPLPLALVAAVHISCLTALIIILRTARPHYPDWQVVGPGKYHWFSFIGSWAFAILISWIWLFVGSARSDAEKQMFSALLLILGFGVGSVYSGYYIVRLRRTALRWCGMTIRWYERDKDVVQDMAEFDAIRRTYSGALHLRFCDGTILKLDTHCPNAQDFVTAILEKAGQP